jgi:hypothetical protein
MYGGACRPNVRDPVVYIVRQELQPLKITPHLPNTLDHTDRCLLRDDQQSSREEDSIRPTRKPLMSVISAKQLSAGGVAAIAKVAIRDFLSSTKSSTPTSAKISLERLLRSVPQTP